MRLVNLLCRFAEDAEGAYLHNGAPHDFVPDFVIRIKGTPARHLILETKGYDPLQEIKEAAAQRWVAAVNADGQFGQWAFRMVTRAGDVVARLDAFDAAP